MDESSNVARGPADESNYKDYTDSERRLKPKHKRSDLSGLVLAASSERTASYATSKFSHISL